MAVLVVFVPIALAWYCLLTADRVNQETYDQVRLGMTLDEVQKAIGSAHDQSSPQEDSGFRGGIVPDREVADMQSEGDWAPRPDDNEPGKRIDWVGLNRTILIRVDHESKVTDRIFFKLKPLGLIDQLRWIVATRM